MIAVIILLPKYLLHLFLHFSYLIFLPVGYVDSSLVCCMPVHVALLLYLNMKSENSRTCINCELDLETLEEVGNSNPGFKGLGNSIPFMGFLRAILEGESLFLLSFSAESCGNSVLLVVVAAAVHHLIANVIPLPLMTMSLLKNPK